MRKVLYTIMFLLFCLCPLKVNAEFLPPVAPQNGMVPDFLMSVAQTQLTNDTGMYSPYKPDYDTVNTIVNGHTIADGMKEMYVNNSTISGLQGVNFYDHEGNPVSYEYTATAFGSSDVGTYSYVFDVRTGEILGYMNGSERVVSTLESQGFHSEDPFPVFVMENLIDMGAPTLSNYQALQDKIEEAKRLDRLAIYDDNDLSQAQQNFINNADYFVLMHSNRFGWTMYAELNAHCICTTYNGYYEYSGSADNAINVYADNPNLVNFENSSGDDYGYLVDWDSVSYYGKTWNWVPRWYNRYNPLWEGGYINMKVPSENEFNQLQELNDDYVRFQPVFVTNNMEGDTFNYTYVTENPPQYNQTVNNNYITNNPISPINYPVNNSYTNNDYSSSDSYVTNIYNYYTTPQEGESVGNITDPVLPENIPILSNLEYRFPFSIPFDMYKLLKGFSVARETPQIDATIVIPRINYEWHIQYDLSAFNDTAHLFRTLFLILYIIGLAYFSYKHFFGS